MTQGETCGLYRVRREVTVHPDNTHLRLNLSFTQHSVQCAEVHCVLHVTKGINFKSSKLNEQNEQPMRKTVY
jgi:hypothetical protein